MKKHKEPFSDPAQLDALNEEVWNMLDRGYEIPESMKSDSDDPAPSPPGTVIGDEAKT